VNVGNGDRDRALGCLDVVTGSDDAIGNLELVEQAGPGTVRGIGWGYDPEATGPLSVVVTVDGTRHVASTNWDRPDVTAHVRKSGNHGFWVEVPAGVGARRVCVTVQGVGRGASADLGCRQVNVNSYPSVGAGADVTSLQSVGPAAGNPLVGIDRDAGVSTQLRDGSVFWLFGDSSDPVSGGGFRYFVNNTAAWAPASSPNTTRDAVAPGNVPHTFIQPAAAFSTPCPAGYKAVMWPLSAVNVAIDATRDRVLAFFGNVCLRGSDAQSRGVSLVQWTYDPAQFSGVGAVGPQLSGQLVLNQNLFPVGSEYGTASMVKDGLLYAYECGRPSDEATGIFWPNDPAFDGCTVARVDPSSPGDVATTAAWEYWNGGTWTNDASWTGNPSNAAKMTMPSPDPTRDKQLPVASLSVVDDPVRGLTMVYSPWPGFTDQVFVRHASTPVGPWSTRTLRMLPGCFEWVNGVELLCYAATAQPWRSAPGSLGIGYYDQFVWANPVRGGYLAATVPA